MKKWCYLFLLFSLNSWANIHLAPPDFETPFGRAIFVDFIKAKYNITYNVASKKSPVVKSTIKFLATQVGKPLFDLSPNVASATLDGEPINVFEVVAPDGTKLRQLSREVTLGEHILTLESKFSTNVRYSLLSRSVSSAFWIRDLKSRMFLEQYIPSNFEFDQYQMIFNITFAGTKNARQDIFTNGEITQLSTQSFQIVFPDYFTVSCPYFHTTPKGAKKRLDFTYQSIDGRMIPVTVYSSWWSNPLKFKNESLRIFKELEADYGPWAHKGFVAYETLPGTGGMEHAGATQTSFAALDHEMLHSYFAKGVMPANGNSGWIDEAIASWRDYGYQRKPLPDFSGSNLGKGSVYKRNTDSRAYRLGREFMAYLDYRLQERGGLKAFLRGYFNAYKRTVVTQEHFKNNLEFFSGLDLSQDFNTYIWGENAFETEVVEEHQVHKKIKNLNSLL